MMRVHYDSFFGENMTHTGISPSLGLAETLLPMLQYRGFKLPAEKSPERAMFVDDLSSRIDELNQKLELFPIQSEEEKTKSLLTLFARTNAEARAVSPQCLELKVVRGQIQSEVDSADVFVPNKLLDEITICYACFFRRQGASGMRFIENLNPVRELVKCSLEQLGYKFAIDAASNSPSRSYYARYQEWACLARADGEHFQKIAGTVIKAKQSVVAA